MINSTHHCIGCYIKQQNKLDYDMSIQGSFHRDRNVSPFHESQLSAGLMHSEDCNCEYWKYTHACFKRVVRYHDQTGVTTGVTTMCCTAAYSGQGARIRTPVKRDPGFIHRHQSDSINYLLAKKSNIQQRPGDSP